LFDFFERYISLFWLSHNDRQGNLRFEHFCAIIFPIFNENNCLIFYITKHEYQAVDQTKRRTWDLEEYRRRAAERELAELEEFKNAYKRGL
jgi:hypothetical protein